jgi:hypothetical protein
MKGKYRRKDKRKDTPPKEDFSGVNAREKQEHTREEKGKAETEKTENNMNKWWHDPAHVIQSIGIGIGTIVALIYAGQLCQMIKSNRINRDALESVQRAFVSYKEMTQTRTKQNGKMFWDFRAIYENSGATPALNTVNQFSYGIGNGELPEDEFQSVAKKSEWTHADIGPKATQEVSYHAIEESFIFTRELGDGFQYLPTATARGDLYFWGWMVYDDVFHSRHVTEFCRHMEPPQLVPSADTQPPKIIFYFNFCRKHNCTDESCEDYKDMLSLVGRSPK